jgi:hypothetical protein
MNISSAETSLQVEAETCGCKEKGRTVTYSFIDSYHSLCIDKRDIIWNQIGACEKILKYSNDDNDRSKIEKEMGELNTKYRFTFIAIH